MTDKQTFKPIQKRFGEPKDGTAFHGQYEYPERADVRIEVQQVYPS